MASWSLANLAELLESMQGDLNTLKLGQVGSKDSFEVQKRFTSAAEEILAITSDPVQSVKNIARGYTASVALKICLDLSLTHHFPEDGSAVEYSTLLERTGADKTVLTMVLNLLSRKGIFKQLGPSQWSHSTLSITLLKPFFNDLISSILDESFKSCFTLPDFLRKTGYKTPTPGRTAFNDYFLTEFDFYRYCAFKDTDKGLRFSHAMIQVAEASLRFFDASYPLQRLAASNLIFDVAGGLGQTAIFLADRLPEQKFVVYDYASVVDEGRRQCPAHLSSSIKYQAHDMFQSYEEAVDGNQDGNVFLLKQVLHDWGDTECIRILSNVLETLGSSGRILIIESVKPLENVSLSTAMSELMVMSMFGGFHRTYADYERLIRAAGFDVGIKCWSGNAGQHDDFLTIEVQPRGAR
ncbi:S-adenosyl-L-methionine-dependent methyltransferase [Hyaloscypha variabilis]